MNKITLNKITLLACLLLFNISSQTMARDITTLKQVTVEASRSNTKLKDMPSHTTVISSKELLQYPGMGLDQVLRQQAGLFIEGTPFQNLDPSQGSMKARGIPGTNASMLVLLDGIPIMDPLFQVVEWSRIPISSIERVEIIRGGQSTMWGGQAGNGVINIISKRATGNGLDVDIGYGMQNTQRYSFGKNIEVNDKLNFRISGNRQTSDGYQGRTPYYDGVWNQGAYPGIEQWNNPSTVQNLNLDGFIKIDPTLNAFVKLGIQNDERTRYNTLGQNIDNNKTAHAGFTKRFSDIHTLTSNAYFQNNVLDKTNANNCFSVNGSTCNQTTATGPGIPDGKTLLPYRNTYEYIPVTEVGNNLAFSKDYGSTRYGYTGGIDYKYTSLSASATSYLKPGTSGTQSPTITQDAAISRVGIFGQLKLRPIDRVEITSGLRYDNWSLINQSTTTGTSKLDSANVSAGHLSPSVMGKIFVNDQISIRGGWYQSYQSPRLSELYRHGVSASNIDFGNNKLTPQTTTTFEVGADIDTIKYGTYGITAYDMQIQNITYKQNLGRWVTNPTTPAQQLAHDLCLMTTACSTSTQINHTINGVDGRTRGIELTGRLPIGNRIVLTGNETLSDSILTHKDSSVSESLGTQLGGVPSNITTGGISMQFTEKWNTYAGVRHVGKSHIDTAHKYAVDGFTTVDLSSRYQINKYAQIYLNAVNLGNKVYSDSGNFNTTASMRNGMPLYVFGGIRLTF